MASPPLPAQQPNKWLVTVSVTFGTLMGALDASIVNVAIPHIQASVGATIEQITWVTTGFVIATVLVMPLTAFFGRIIGQKRLYMLCLVLFLVGSILCGLARSLTALVIFRVIQGLGAGALQPTEQAILRQTFPPKEQGMAMAVFGMAVMIGPAAGPILGGYIVDHWTWPWIFYINIPVGALGLFMVWRFVHEPEDVRAANAAMAARARGHTDWAGLALLTLGLATMQYVLEEGNRNDWFHSNTIVACALVSALGLVALVLRELTAKVPAVDLSLFRDRVFLSGTLVGTAMFAMLMSFTFLLPLFMQLLLGFTATQAGMTLLPRTLAMMVATPVIGRMYNRVSPRITVSIGVLLFAVSAYEMSHFTLSVTSGQIVRVLIVQGLAFSCLFVPLMTVALARIPRHKMTDATGLNSLFRQVGGSLGLAVFATLLGRFATTARADLLTHLTPGRPEVVERLGQIQAALQARGLDPSAAQEGALRMMSLLTTQQSMVLSFEKLFLLGGGLFLLILPLILLLRTDGDVQKRGPAESVHVEI